MEKEGDTGTLCHLSSLAKLLKKNREQYAKIITEEMGKPITQSYAEIDKCIWLCEYYSEYAEPFLQDQIIPTEFRKSFISFEPLGIVVGIMPWNFPFLAGYAICSSDIN